MKRGKQALALTIVYALALLLGGSLFFAYRVYVHHQTFASRSFFWIGDIHTHDDQIGFRMAPLRQGIAVLHHGIEEPSRRILVRTDQFGFRIPVHRDSTAVRPGGVIGIGCSCTFGHGVAAESTYVEFTGKMLQRPAYNLGVCSYSTVTSIELLRRYAGTLQPDFVLYGFGNFHLERSARSRTDGVLFQAYLKQEGDSCRVVPPLFSNRVNFEVLPQIEEQYYQVKLDGGTPSFNFAKLRALAPLAIQDIQRALRPRHLRLAFDSNPLSPATYARWLVRSLLDISRTYETRVVLLYFPASFGEKPLAEIHAALADLDPRQELVVVDASKELFAGMSSAEQYQQSYQVPRDGHPNGRMHLGMARAVVEELSRRNLLPGAAVPQAAP